MKKNKLTIDLGNLELSEKEKLKLLDAVHKAVDAKTKKKDPAPKTEPESGRRAAMAPSDAPVKAARSMAATAVTEATLKVKITGTEPGLSEVRATHKGVERILDRSGELVFGNVARGDVMRIQGKSLGKTVFTIDRETDPPEKTFEPGTFRFNFFILG